MFRTSSYFTGSNSALAGYGPKRSFHQNSLAHSTRPQSHQRPIISPFDPFYIPQQYQAPTNSRPTPIRAGRATATTALNKGPLYSSSSQQSSSTFDHKSFFQPSAPSHLNIVTSISAQAQLRIPKASFVNA